LHPLRAFDIVLTVATKKNKPAKKALLLGLGLDNKDGHTRITSGKEFHLVGGSAETHGVMQEKAVKMSEHLKRRGKTLATVTRDEFHEIADKIGMKLVEPKPRLPQKPDEN
jgi:hypothetical protein